MSETSCSGTSKGSHVHPHNALASRTRNTTLLRQACTRPRTLVAAIHLPLRATRDEPARHRAQRLRGSCIGARKEDRTGWRGHASVSDGMNAPQTRCTVADTHVGFMPIIFAMRAFAHRVLVGRLSFPCPDVCALAVAAMSSLDAL